MQTGELERLKEFGITKTMLQEQADAMGIVFQNNKGQITSYENLNTALFAIMEDRYKGSMEIQSKTFRGMVSNAQDMMGDIGETVGEPIFNAFKDSLENILELGQNLLDSGQIEKWAENVANGIENLIGFVETVGNAFDWMKENIDALTPVAISIGVAIAAVMTPAIIAWTTATTAAAIAQWALIAPILATVAPILAVGAVIGGLIYVWQNYGNDIKSYVSEAWDNVQTTFNNMISFVSGINLWEIGANMIRGLVDGMLSMLDSAMETAKNIGSGIANTLKNFFQINSPSKLMFSYGGYIGQGLDLGMQSTENNVKNTAESMGQSTETGLAGNVTNIANGVAEKFKNFFGIASPSKLMFSYGGYIGQGLDLGMQSETNNLKATGQSMAKATEGEFVDSTSSASNSFAPSINASNIGNNIANTLKSFFDIQSPSKLMFEYDGYIGQGLDLGMQSKTQNLEATGQSMAKATDGEFTSTTSNSSTSYAPSINITVNGGSGGRETALSVRKEVEKALEVQNKKLMLRLGGV